MLKEFKEFISKGNVIDMAVGLVTGSAFTAIVSSLVSDVITPILSIFIGKINFSDLKIVIKAAEGDAVETAIHYGNFLQATLNFLIVSFVIFMVVKAMNKMRDETEKLLKMNKEEDKKEEEKVEEVKVPEDIQLLTEIRDLLKKA